MQSTKADKRILVLQIDAEDISKVIVESWPQNSIMKCIRIAHDVSHILECHAGFVIWQENGLRVYM